MNIGQRIKQIRESMGLSQEELAKKLGYKSRSTINNLGLTILINQKWLNLPVSFKQLLEFLWDGKKTKKKSHPTKRWMAI